MLPELNISENILRSVFGVWQEYRGLGLYDGQSHAAELLHTIYILVISLFAPIHLARYIFIFLTYILGGIGIYFLLRKYSSRLIAIVGSLFYLFNFATIQMFYTPFEAFAIHFAALPWLALTISNLLTTPTKRNFLVFFGVSLLTTPQFFIPTLFLPTTILLAVITICHLLTQTIKPIKPALWAALGFVCINAFWLLPFVWGLPQNAPVIMSAKINQMSSDENFIRNQAFGDIQNVFLLRGFALDFQDYTKDGLPIFLMQAWRSFLHIPFITGIQIGFLFLAAIGWVVSLKKTNRFMLPYSVLFVICVFFLGNNIPAVQSISFYLREKFPSLAEGLRFPFTKFSLLFVLSYSIFVAIGTKTLIKVRLAPWIVAGMILLQAYPAFTGYFISPNLHVSFPTDYQQMYSYLQQQNKNNRIMLLPQPEYWSWKLYNFGYRGSGFVWFGVPQPLLDRAFDPWSKTNENYYWELSRALYAKDTEGLDALLDKYDIGYILIDEHIISASNNRSLFIDETKNLLAALPHVQHVKTFGALSLYQRTDKTTQSFISLGHDLPTVSPLYQWTDNDVAYRQLGPYIATETGDTTYFWRNLFTKRSVAEQNIAPESLRIDSQPLYDSTSSADLAATNVKPCGVFEAGTQKATNIGFTLKMESFRGRNCLSFDIPMLSHKFGYVAVVENTHESGQPLMISFINDTARHVELETYLNGKKDYFILPPLASDGLGYTIYISNNSIGSQKTMNTIDRIHVYRIPYDAFVASNITLRTRKSLYSDAVVVDHPNPSSYRVAGRTQGTLILSQSFDPGWVAFTFSKKMPWVNMLTDHVLVNNWENGWTINPGTNSTIYIFFWPQLFEWIGFIVLLLPFLFARKLASEE